MWKKCIYKYRSGTLNLKRDNLGDWPWCVLVVTTRDSGGFVGHGKVSCVTIGGFKVNRLEMCEQVCCVTVHACGTKNCSLFCDKLPSWFNSTLLVYAVGPLGSSGVHTLATNILPCWTTPGRVFSSLSHDNECGPSSSPFGPVKNGTG